MKNIHVISTGKPSRLYKFEGKLIKNDLIGLYNFEEEGYISKNIYITSDEEIKEGDWFLNTLNGTIDKCEDIISQKNVNLSSWLKKIILTTDQDLIGVQAIDDEFLEWFVNNPSCEFVELNRNYNRGNGKYYYKIIIPKKKSKKIYEMPLAINYLGKTCINTKEEPKPHSFCETPNEKCTMNYCDDNGCMNRKREDKPKQETLEEGFIRTIIPLDFTEADFASFKLGIKYQQERISKLRDELFNQLPIGEINSFDLLKIINNHIKKLDKL